MARSIPRGLSKWIACPSVANPKAPTRAELTAGVDITNSVAGINGFSLTNSPVTTPDLGSRFDKSVAGIDSAGDSSLNMWDEIARGTSTTDAARVALAKDVQLYMVKLPYGNVAGRRLETWNVTSTGVNDQNDMSSAMQYQIGFSVNEVPEQNGVVPALT